MLVFGTGHGLAPEIYTADRSCLKPVRAGQYNHLSVRTAAAVVIDRIIGERGLVMPLP
jgi:tRNA (guanine37-N1)-methyltransferase